MKDQKVIDALCEEEGIVNDGDSTWSNDHPRFNFNLFHCYWCLKGFPTWEKSRTCPCDKTGTPAQMIR